MGIGYIWALLLGIGMIFMPESPRWDICNDNHSRAFTTMTKFYGVSRNHRAVHRETKEINEALAASSGDHPYVQLCYYARMETLTVLDGMKPLRRLECRAGISWVLHYSSCSSLQVPTTFSTTGRQSLRALVLATRMVRPSNYVGRLAATTALIFALESADTNCSHGYDPWRRQCWSRLLWPVHG